jgi:hypothetical protein
VPEFHQVIRGYKDQEDATFAFEMFVHPTKEKLVFANRWFAQSAASLCVLQELVGGSLNGQRRGASGPAASSSRARIAATCQPDVAMGF